jgi:hypothetical protein
MAVVLWGPIGDTPSHARHVSAFFVANFKLRLIVRPAPANRAHALRRQLRFANTKDLRDFRHALSPKFGGACRWSFGRVTAVSCGVEVMVLAEGDVRRGAGACTVGSNGTYAVSLLVRHVASRLMLPLQPIRLTNRSRNRSLLLMRLFD